MDWTTDLLKLWKKNWFLSWSVLKIVFHVPHPSTNISLLPSPMCLFFFRWMSWSNSKLRIRTHFILALYLLCCKMLLLYISDTIVSASNQMPGGPWAGHVEFMCLCSKGGSIHMSRPVPPPMSILVQGLRKHVQDWAVLTDLGKDHKKGDLGWMLLGNRSHFWLAILTSSCRVRAG